MAESLGNWDDEDDDIFSQPAIASSSANPLADEDLFHFADSLTLQAEEEDEQLDFANEYSSDSTKKKLPPLPKGVIDLTRKRGVLLERHNNTNNSNKQVKEEEEENGSTEILKPSKNEPYVEFHYEGFLLSNGEKFDSSRDQNYPMIVQLDIPPSGKSSLISGLELGLRELTIGDKATLTITSDFAYGEKGTVDIPSNSDLKFEVEILDIRSTHKKVEVIDMSKNDLSRLEDIKREREIAQQRREQEAQAKDAEKQRKADRAAALREKLANKNKPKGGKKGGKKKK